MRDIKTLLQLMLDNKHLFNMSIGGLCIFTDILLYKGLINKEEQNSLLYYIENNRPYNLRTLFRMQYYWKRGNNKPRIKWLKHHIKKLV